MQSDAELIDQILAGETQAFAVLVQRYERLVYATAMRSVRDPHGADDVTQETFVAAFKSLSNLRDKASFPAWLLGIARRKAAKDVALRVKSPLTNGVEIDIVSPDSVERSTASTELLELVAQLPEQERIVIGLRHFDGHSTQEIANMTGRPLGTVTKQLSRAHERLHGMLTQESVK